MNGTAVCCARLDDFDWVVPNRVPDIFTSDRHMEVYLSDLSHDQKFCRVCFRSCLLGRLLCRCPCLWLLRQCPWLYLERRPLRWWFPSLRRWPYVSEWFAWPRLGANSERVLSDCCFIDVGVLVPEMFPVVSARGAVVPMSLPAITEVFSSAVFAGGIVADAAPLAVVGTVTACVPVLPDAGSELPADSDRALPPVSSCGMFNSGRRPNVRRSICFRRLRFLPLSHIIIRSLPRSHRTCRMTLDICCRIVRLLWTGTLRQMQTCCWGIRRTESGIWTTSARPSVSRVCGGA